MSVESPKQLPSPVIRAPPVYAERAIARQILRLRTPDGIKLFNYEHIEHYTIHPKKTKIVKNPAKIQRTFLFGLSISAQDWAR